MKVKTSFFWMVCLLVFVMVFSACGDDDEPTVSGGSGGNSSAENGDTNDNDNGDDDTVSVSNDVDIPSPLDDMETEQWSFGGAQFIIPEADIEGGFVFVVNRVFLYGQFNGQPVTLVAQRMAPEAVYALPGGRIFYRGNGTESRNAVVVQRPNETEFLADYSLGSDGLLLSWNADGTWLTYIDNGLYVAAADGSFQSEPILDAEEAIWLDDDTLLYTVEDDEGALIAVMRYDPTTQTSTEVLLDYDPAEDGLLSLEDELFELGYRYASPNVLNLTVINPDGDSRFTIFQPANRSATGICDEWSIVRSNPETGDMETIYANEETHALSNLHIMPDDSVLALRWFRQDCAFSNAIEAELIRVYPDGEVEVVTDRILVNTSAVQINNLERRYTVSPDGRYVMWIGRDGGAAGDTTLELMDLEAGVQKRVAQMPALSGSRDVFFSSVTWLLE